ncbi:39S ribosomal protein L54, mitochondrial [Rhinatrema bivittatum]|uniref:39S ribosomal protein L54, mitochondrial n=1 Tax=Rhinatrema bivittatum TaxID=194408 RepID=UPI00112DC0A4|nr:39S ribosomal protein L54, mitochondrial [Rhinatrema bivittatum]
MAWGLVARCSPPGPNNLYRLLARGYAKKAVVKGKGKGASIETLKDPEVCKDPGLLTSHAMGVNIYKQGQEVALKEDSEYPEWLFQLHLGPPKKLHELDPESPKYWRTLRKQHIWRNNKLSKNKKF